jgi:hypothetical protein
MLTYDLYKTMNSHVLSIYKLIITAEFATNKNFINVICFIVNGFVETVFKLCLYSLTMAMLWR